MLKNLIQTYYLAGCPNGHPYAVGDVSIELKIVFQRAQKRIIIKNALFVLNNGV